MKKIVNLFLGLLIFAAFVLIGAGLAVVGGAAKEYDPIYEVPSQ